MVDENLVLAADIGGTNSRFGVYEGNGDAMKKMAGAWLATGESDSFAQLLERLRTTSVRPYLGNLRAAVFAVAGPVERGNYSAPAYIDWTIAASTAEDFLGARTSLINDFVAQAYACRALPGKRAKAVLAGEADPHGTVAAIGAGTGLGQAALVPLPGDRFYAIPSEGGHGAFPFVGENEQEFRRWYEKQLSTGYVTLCDLLSGRGLAAIHFFVTGRKSDPPEVSRLLPEHPAVRDLFARFYGRACRDYALNVLATGGVYVAGGVAAKNPDCITCGAFAAEFHASHTMAHILEKIPVLLMDDQESGLWGAALLAGQQAR